MIRKHFGLAYALILALAMPSAGFAAPSGQARTVLTWKNIREQLNASAKDFHSLSADIERTKVTLVVNDRSTETGDIFVHGDKMLLEIKAPDPRTILRNGDNLSIYNPGLKRVEEYNLGKNRALVEQFLLLGFGTRGEELEKGYEIAVLREEKLDDHKAAVLELTPKSKAVRSQIAHIQIWLDEGTWLPAQQKFVEAGSGDYSVVRYSHVVRNAYIPDSKFKPHWPKGTQKVKPRG